MAKKDFTQVNTEPLYNSAIAKATQEQGKRKPRKTYNAQEAEEILESGKTSGRKGLKLKRINLAFTPLNYDYVSVMAQVTGQNMTTFLNGIIEQHRAEHGDLYRQALEFRSKL